MRNLVLLGVLLVFTSPAHAGINKYTVHVAIHDARDLKGYSAPIYRVTDCDKAINVFINNPKNKAKFNNHFIEFACMDNKSFNIRMIKKTKWFKSKVTIEYTEELFPYIK